MHKIRRTSHFYFFVLVRYRIKCPFVTTKTEVIYLGYSYTCLSLELPPRDMGLATNPPRRLRLVLASALLLHTTSNISSPSGNASFVLGAPADADNFAAKDGNNDGTLYTEDLSLQRLGAHHVAARFVFRSQWTPREVHRCQDHEDWEGEKEGGRGKLCHFEAVFPRAFGVLLDRFQVSVLQSVGHLRAIINCRRTNEIILHTTTLIAVNL